MSRTSLLSRRSFCRRGAGAAGAFALPGSLFAKCAIPVAIQLFSVREQCQKDLAGVLSQLAAFGYRGVEFAGFYGRNAADVRRMLDQASLQCCGSHTPLDQLTPERFQQTVEFQRVIGNKNLIVPGLPAQYHSPEGWRSAARLFNSLSTRLEPLGLRIGYHNHASEFQKDASGQMPWDVLFANTRPQVTIQLDTGNARIAGADLNSLLRKYPGRVRSIHVKDHLPGHPDVLLGTSDFDWPTFLHTCESVAGTEWYIIEHESHDVPAMDAAEQSLRRFELIRSPNHRPSA